MDLLVVEMGLIRGTRGGIIAVGEECRAVCGVIFGRGILEGGGVCEADRFGGWCASIGGVSERFLEEGGGGEDSWAFRGAGEVFGEGGVVGMGDNVGGGVFGAVELGVEGVILVL